MKIESGYEKEKKWIQETAEQYYRFPSQPSWLRPKGTPLMRNQAGVLGILNIGRKGSVESPQHGWGTGSCFCLCDMSMCSGGASERVGRVVGGPSCSGKVGIFIEQEEL